MKSFAERLREDRRLVMLRILAEQPGYRANSSIMHAGLQHLGVVASRDDVRTDAHWLRDQGLISITEAAPGIEVYALASRGSEVADGHCLVPGVSRPSPK
ncbi:hypothetical protein DCD74_02435 [Lysobacter oculi]|uniref:ArsR family transcriptional regulator n=1 Tax=Solilutibacter oculi TaxID=2698682 RepID=A0A344J3U1_9GAMM|nr:ArsR family transcriptional regulator [Lysobacter oculi]AXA83701.1 hypothetical protein DCD74_02435 [Lysobacter oculi]